MAQVFCKNLKSVENYEIAKKKISENGRYITD
jgi:hypothetical protein